VLPNLLSGGQRVLAIPLASSPSIVRPEDGRVGAVGVQIRETEKVIGKFLK